MPKFFITHSGKDMEFAKKLNNDLHSFGLEGFLDAYAIKPGDDFVERINKGLEECDVYIPILSFSALASVWCKEEINTAIALSNQPSRQGKPRIIAVLVEDCAAAMPSLLQHRLYINFSVAYLSALLELLEKGFGISPSVIRKASMFSGPRISSGEEGNYKTWFGAAAVLEFSKKDCDKTLKVSVDSKQHILSIELWREAYNMHDLSAWLKNRVEITRSPQKQNPMLTWKIEAGMYTLYFVDHVCHSSRWLSGGDPARGYGYSDPFPDYEILYRIEIL